MIDAMRGAVLWAGLAGVVGGTGCSARFVYFSPYHENVVAVPVETLHGAAVETCNALVTEGEPWLTEYDTGMVMRVKNAHGNSHLTIVDLKFRGEGPDQSAVQVEAYSQARASWVTGGITSSATQTIAKRKAEALRQEILGRVQGGGGGGE